MIENRNKLQGQNSFEAVKAAATRRGECTCRRDSLRMASEWELPQLTCVTCTGKLISHAQNLVKCNLAGVCGTPQRECSWCREITSTGCDTAAATTAAGTIDARAASSCMTASACMPAWRDSSRRFRCPVHWPMAVCERWQAGPLRLAARALRWSDSETPCDPRAA